MREGEFIAALQALVESDVSGLDADGKAAMLVAAGERLISRSAPAGCRIVPFLPGRRPVDEASHPWLGSSDQAALILGGARTRKQGIRPHRGHAWRCATTRARRQPLLRRPEQRDRVRPDPRLGSATAAADGLLGAGRRRAA
jgi:hypothetical protein